MQGPGLFLDILIFAVAFIYWYMTGQYIPALLGVIFTLIFIYSDKLYFIALIMGLVTILSVIFFIFYNPPSEEIAISHVTVTALYILVIFLKSKSIFDAD